MQDGSRSQLMISRRPPSSYWIGMAFTLALGLVSSTSLAHGGERDTGGPHPDTGMHDATSTSDTGHSRDAHRIDDGGLEADGGEREDVNIIDDGGLEADGGVQEDGRIYDEGGLEGDDSNGSDSGNPEESGCQISHSDRIPGTLAMLIVALVLIRLETRRHERESASA